MLIPANTFAMLGCEDCELAKELAGLVEEEVKEEALELSGTPLDFFKILPRSGGASLWDCD